MLEVSDYEAINKLLQFICALLNKCSGSNGTPNITGVFLMYVDMIGFEYRNYSVSRWSSKMLS